MINDRLVWYLEDNNILADIQCGFRKRKSTLDHLVRLESFIRDAFLNKQEVVSNKLNSTKIPILTHFHIYVRGDEWDWLIYVTFTDMSRHIDVQADWRRVVPTVGLLTP